MEKDLVSIIVPCYNASRYLKGVFLSIQNQTYQNIEAIFVDDGSTDDTGKVLDEFAKTYAKAKVVHKPNGGSSTARNAGIKIAKGSYITFMDADDIIHPQTIDILYQIIVDNSADVAMYNFKRVNENYVYQKFKTIDNRKINIYEGEDDVYTMFL